MTEKEELLSRLEAIELAARNLDAYLKWQLSAESPGYHPTFPSAVAYFRGAFDPEVFSPGMSRFEEWQKSRRTPPARSIDAGNGWVLVPREPTEAQWGGLARAIVMWWGMGAVPTGALLHQHLTRTGEAIPDWLHAEIPVSTHVPSKGTVAACIYRAMLAAAPPPAAKEAE